MTQVIIGNKVWNFELRDTFNGVYSFDLIGSVAYKNIVFATLDVSDDAFIGVYGYGDTSREAYEDAQRKIAETITKLYPV
jgi:hypothetical protein